MDTLNESCLLVVAEFLSDARAVSSLVVSLICVERHFSNQNSQLCVLAGHVEEGTSCVLFIKFRPNVAQISPLLFS